ncbi:HpcH/HpaI aldolase/citrate lyase family protein [Haloferax sp. S1W]|uniref:HpcH/HpaI aldolase/citrate lyase family protein n=1 Tax=Haloferax sp. S1W TaxID=3377110 RepID=UPI0037CB48C2
MTERLRRSFLYTPADDAEMMEKALGLDAADAVIFDLEDAVPNKSLPDARANLEDVLGERSDRGAERCVRINGLQTTHWKDDIEAAVAAGVDTIVLPMVERPAQTERAVAAVEDASGAVPEFIVTVETPRGLFAADELAAHGGRVDAVTGFSYGIGDYARAVGTTGAPAQLHEYVSNVVVSAAAVGGLDPISTVYQDFTDDDGLRERAAQARESGYIGQKAIHPRQLSEINDMFTPTAEEAEEAARFIDAFDAAERDSIVVDGVFLDTAIVEQYRTILHRYEVVGS